MGCVGRKNFSGTGDVPSLSVAILNTVCASVQFRAKMETQSKERHAGTIPEVLIRPIVGFKPTTLLRAAGTLPDPAVSVPKAKLTCPKAVATADPELEPPEMYSGLCAFRQTP